MDETILDGPLLGDLLGAEDGILDVEAIDGAMDGLQVGDTEGAIVCLADGIVDGMRDGRLLGPTDGDLVGAKDRYLTGSSS